MYILGSILSIDSAAVVSVANELYVVYETIYDVQSTYGYQGSALQS
jgi:hypothetical protein